MRARFCGDVITDYMRESKKRNATMSNSYSQMELSVPQNVINADYKLSLKHFFNKDFHKSYALITKLHDCCYRNFERNIISEKLFIKIVNLYLTHVGMLFYPENAENRFQLPILERKALSERIKHNEFWSHLEAFYGSAAEVPPSLLYQVSLLNYAYSKEVTLADLKSIMDQFDHVYSSIDFNAKTDVEKEYLKRFAELYVFKALPDAGRFDSALILLQKNPLLDSEQSKERLLKIKQIQSQERERHKKVAEERALEERAKKALEIEKREKERQEANLKYRSLKHIKQAREKELTGSTDQLSHSATVKPIEEWILKAKFLIKLSNNFVQNNYLALLLALAITLITRRFARARNLNLLEKFQETVRMAFKVTYL